MFGGFKALSANFTPTPNQFFEEVVGHYPCRVVTVVAILIRATLGWEDPDTGDRRIEAELPLSAFLRPDLCENSARKGLAEAITAGLIVRTVSANSREGARYALRWADGAALERALEKSRRMQGTDVRMQDTDLRTEGAGSAPSGPEQDRGSKNGPLMNHVRGPQLGGPKNAPPYIDKTKTPNPEKETKSLRKQTLNVGDDVHCVMGEQPKPRVSVRRGSRADPPNRLDKAVTSLVMELRDLGSERRHRQLLEICEEHGLDDLAREALYATRRRLASEAKQGVLEKPGAYYQRILIKKLEERQVFVPKAGEDDPDEVRRLARQSLGLD